MKKILILAALAVLGGACSSGSKPYPKTAAAIDAAADKAVDTYTASDWQDVNGWRIRSLTDILGDVSNDAAASDLDAMSRDCLRLQSSAGLLAAQLPIPGAEEASYEFGRALDLYQDSARDCIAGVADVDASELGDAAAEMREATSHVTAATAAL